MAIANSFAKVKYPWSHFESEKAELVEAVK